MRAFTTSHKQIVNVLQNTVEISKSSILNNDNTENKKCKFTAIWDTGATNTMISQSVVDKCRLIATGVVPVYTAGGLVQAGTYIIDLVLPDNMIIPNLNVTCGKLNSTDVLIGMDIIQRGDFSVSNYESQTKFTFRMPSLEHSDYVKNSTIRAGDKPSRNDPCPCGSGEKYKNCHGRNN